MKIEYDVYGVARFFGVDPAMLQAIVNAEGDIVSAVRKSVPCITLRDTALRIAARTAVRAMHDWIKTGGEERQNAFIAFWANRWAPLVARDAKALEANWAMNALWTPTGEVCP